MARKKPYFQKLLRRYQNCKLSDTIGRRHVFELMVKNATKFAEWNEIFRYGNSESQYEALQQMKATVLDEERVIDVQRNILTLFELVTDSVEQTEILEKYIKSHCEKDDLLFAVSIYSATDDFWDDVYKLAKGYYRTLDGLNRGIEARRKKNARIMENMG